MFKEYLNRDFLLKIFRSLMIFLLFNFSYIFQYIPLIIFNISIDTVRESIPIQVLLSTFSSLIIFIILVLVYRKDLIKEFKKFRDNGWSGFDAGFKCWIAGLGIMFVSNILLMVLFKSGGADNENAVQIMIQALPIVMGLDVCLLAPFNEEIVFRKTLKDVVKNKFAFIFLSFLLFGGAHVVSTAENIVDWLYIIPYGALGGAFAYAYYKTDSVFTSMSLHMIHNTLVFLLSVFTRI